MTSELAPGDIAKAHLTGSAEVKVAATEACIAEIVAAAKVIADSMRGGGKLLLCGNGGSAADSQHLAGEFVSLLRQEVDRPALAAIALTTDTSFLTARANDFGFQDIFARQVEALGRHGDVLLGISTSGNSKNVVAAVRRAKGLGLLTVVMTGQDGGQLGGVADIAVRVPSHNVQHIQETHIAIGHIICLLVERLLFPEACGEG